MDNHQQVFDGSDYQEQSGGSKFWEKAKKDPVVPLGILGGLGVVAYQAFRLKNRGNTKLSVYLIHTRVAAQGTVIGALTLGVLYSMYKEYIVKEPQKNKIQ